MKADILLYSLRMAKGSLPIDLSRLALVVDKTNHASIALPRKSQDSNGLGIAGCCLDEDESPYHIGTCKVSNQGHFLIIRIDTNSHQAVSRRPLQESKYARTGT